MSRFLVSFFYLFVVACFFLSANLTAAQIREKSIATGKSRITNANVVRGEMGAALDEYMRRLEG